MTYQRFTLEVDRSTDEIPDWWIIGNDTAIYPLIWSDATGDDEGERVVDNAIGEVVALKDRNGTWEVDPDGLARVREPINYTAFAHALLHGDSTYSHDYSV